MSADDWLNNYGYQTDYKARSDLVRMWHQTGEDRDGTPNPLYYSDDKPALQWTDAAKGGVADQNMDTIYLRITALDADAVDQAGTSWYQFALNMWDIVEAIGKNTDKIRDGDGCTAWKSEAATAFYSKGPGAAIKSLRDWQNAAYANSRAMHDLAGIIRRYRTQIEALHTAYKADLTKLETWWNANMAGGDWNTSTLKNQPEEARNIYVDMVKRVREGIWYGFDRDRAIDAGLSLRKFSDEAKTIQQNMANEFMGPINTMAGEGRSTTYEGPDNAVTVDSATLSKVFTKLFPGVGKPSINAKTFGSPVPIPHVLIPAMPDPPKPSLTAPTVPGQQPVNPADLPNAPSVNVPSPGTAPDPSLMPQANQIMLPALGGAGPSGLPGAPSLGSLPANANSSGLGTPTSSGFRPPASPGLSKGLLGRAQSPGSPPGSPMRPSDSRTRRGVNRGVLGSDAESENGRPGGSPARPGTPNPSGGGRRGSRATPPAPPGLQEPTENLFGDGGAPKSPSVLGRPNLGGTDTFNPLRGRPSADVTGRQAYTPPGTRSPVLGGSQGDAPGRTGTGPGTPPSGRRTTGRSTDPRTGYPAAPSDSDWVNAHGEDAPSVAPPVLEGTTPTGPVTAPTSSVLGRSDRSGQGGRSDGDGRAARRGQRADQSLRSRRVAPPARTADTGEQQPVVVGDEAFSMETPGGGVLNTERPAQRPEVEPKPTLGAGS